MENLTKERGKAYFDILSRSTAIFNWLFLTLIVFTGIIFSVFYKTHFGVIDYAISFHNFNLENFDSYYEMVDKQKYREKIGDNNNSLSEMFLKNQLKSELEKKRSYFENIKSNDNNYYKIPFLEISFYETDFIFILLIMGTILLYWLCKNVRYNRDVLKEYYNSPNKLENTDNEIISSLFFYIFPAGEKFKFYKHFELALLLYISSICIFFLKNMYELIFERRGIDGLKFSDYPGFEKYVPVLICGNLIYIFTIFISFLLLLKTRIYLKDLRNLILLTRWTTKSFFPAICDVFQQSNKRLMENKNLIEYRKADNTDNLYLCIRLLDKSSRVYETKSLINLSYFLKKYYKENIKWNTRSNIPDPHLNRILTVEEENMREFFKNVLILYKPEFRSEWGLFKNV